MLLQFAAYIWFWCDFNFFLFHILFYKNVYLQHIHISFYIFRIPHYFYNCYKNTYLHCSMLSNMQHKLLPLRLCILTTHVTVYLYTLYARCYYTWNCFCSFLFCVFIFAYTHIFFLLMYICICVVCGMFCILYIIYIFKIC